MKVILPAVLLLGVCALVMLPAAQIEQPPKGIHKSAQKACGPGRVAEVLSAVEMRCLRERMGRP